MYNSQKIVVGIKITGTKWNNAIVPNILAKKTHAAFYSKMTRLGQSIYFGKIWIIDDVCILLYSTTLLVGRSTVLLLYYQPYLFNEDKDNKLFRQVDSLYWYSWALCGKGIYCSPLFHLLFVVLTSFCLLLSWNSKIHYIPSYRE